MTGAQAEELAAYLFLLALVLLYLSIVGAIADRRPPRPRRRR